MNERLLGKATLVVLLLLALLTPLAGCFSYHNDRDRDRPVYVERDRPVVVIEGERHDEHRDNGRHDDDHGGDRH